MRLCRLLGVSTLQSIPVENATLARLPPGQVESAVLDAICDLNREDQILFDFAKSLILGTSVQEPFIEPTGCDLVSGASDKMRVYVPESGSCLVQKS